MIRDNRYQVRANDRNAQEVLWFWNPWRSIFSILWFSLLALTSYVTHAVTVPAGDLVPYGSPVTTAEENVGALEFGERL